MNLKQVKRYFIALICLSFLQMTAAWSADGPLCSGALLVDDPVRSAGAQFLHNKNPDLHNTKAVNEAAVESGLKVSDKPTDKLVAWLYRTEASFAQASMPGNELDRENIKKYYRDLFLTKPENVPESFFEFQKTIARQRGHGDIQISPEMRKALVENAIKDQSQSLDGWLDYFLSSDSMSYPTWTKCWVLMALGKMGRFDSESGTFEKRSNGTMAAFPELNREALANVIDAILKKAGGPSLQDIQDPRLLSVIKSGNFAKLYGYFLRAAKMNSADTSSLDGRWIVYKQGSDHMPLVNSLLGKNTGWCTAGEATAKSQLAMGDFHVFYTRDTKGEYAAPRVAIRMQQNSIAEVRGVGPGQELDRGIVSSAILEKKFQEFGAEGEKYKRKAQDMKYLTDLENKMRDGQKFSEEDLRFLYEIDRKIEGFGYKSDPRRAELLDGRNQREDLYRLLDGKFQEDEIGLTKEEVLNGTCRYFYGDLNLNDFGEGDFPNGLKLPEIVNGSLFLSRIFSPIGLKLPRFINGDLSMGISSGAGLILPRAINGHLFLGRLESAEGMEFPETITGGMSLFQLKSAYGLQIPKNFSGDLVLMNLRSVQGLTFPKVINGNLDVRGLISTKGLKLPQVVNGDLYLSSLTSAKGLKLPQVVNGDLYLGSLTSAEGLKLPKILGGQLRVNENLSPMRFEASAGILESLTSLWRRALGMLSH